MSLESKSKAKGRLRLFGGLSALGLGAALLLVPASGAEWSATDNGRVNVAMGSLSIELSDANNTGTFVLDYFGLAPGTSVTKRFTVTNSGTIPGDVTVTPADLAQALVDAHAGAPNVTVADLAHLLVKIENNAGTVVYQPQLPIISGGGGPSMMTQVSLGSLNPGQSRTYAMTVSLHQDATNNWQGASFGYDAAVTLTQQ